MIRLATQLTFLLFTTACTIGQPNTLTILPTSDEGLSSFIVELQFQGEADGSTQITFPQEWGPEIELGSLRQGLEITGGEVVGLDSGNIPDGNFTVQHPANALIRLRYKIEQDYEGEPNWDEHRVPGMRPVLQDSYASIIGHTIFPELSAEALKFRVNFEDFSDSQTTAFSHPIDGPRGSVEMTLAQIKNSIYTFGDFRYREEKGETLNIRTSIRGGWSLSDIEISQATSAVISQASVMFEDAPFEQYFVALTALPALPNGSAVIGTGLEESFFILATPNADASNLTHTIIHEVLHEWLPRRMGTTEEATDPTRMWFTEGFTEYYSQLTLLKSDLISVDMFLENMSKLWKNYQTSTVQSVTSGQLQDRIFESHETQRLPYQRGALLALHWDSVARQKEGGALVNALIGLLDQADGVRKGATLPAFSDEDLLRALSQEIGPEFERDYERYLQQGLTIQADHLMKPSCVAVTKNSDGLYEFKRTEQVTKSDCRLIILGE